ncbi:SMI1/KNR4 family protein [Legionella sp.]|uniref:SMI1/KNR4 family protein n=1 Tax=Legionella sp. TaxID=459 RepID=UPI003CBE8FA0
MNDEKRYERVRLKMLEERKKHPFSLNHLQFDRLELPATEEEIEAVQNYIGHPLPELYKEICRHFNEGLLKLNCFEDVEGRMCKIGFFFRVTNEEKNNYHIWQVIRNFRDELTKDCLPFADDSLGLSAFYLIWVNDIVEVWQLLHGELAWSFSGCDDEDDNYYCHVLVNKSFDVFLESL